MFFDDNSSFLLFFLVFSRFSGLERDDAEPFENRTDQNGQNGDGRDVFEQNDEEFFALEGMIVQFSPFDFVNDNPGIQDIPDKNTGEQGADGHQHGVGNEVAETEEIHAENLEISQQTKG